MTADIPSLAGKLSDALTSALPWIWQPLLRLLAQGQPVTIEQLASAAGRPGDEVRQVLAELPDTEYDEQGRIVGYGLSQRPTQHRFTVEGRELYTWCALDTLIFPVALGSSAEVESPCHATGTPVRLTVQPDGVAAVDPPTAVVSIVTPQQCTSVRSAFCNEVHFFVSPEAARQWRSEHPGGTVLPVVEADVAAREIARQRLSQPGCC